MKRILVIAMFAVLAVVPFGAGSPTAGSASFPSADVSPSVWSKTMAFRGGERAAVIAINEQEKEAQLEITVTDAKTNHVLATDKSANPLVSGYVGVVFYPPRDGEYRIEVKSPNGSATKAYIAIK